MSAAQSLSAVRPLDVSDLTWWQRHSAPTAHLRDVMAQWQRECEVLNAQLSVASYDLYDAEVAPHAPAPRTEPTDPYLRKLIGLPAKPKPFTLVDSRDTYDEDVAKLLADPTTAERWERWLAQRGPRRLEELAQQVVYEALVEIVTPEAHATTEAEELFREQRVAFEHCRRTVLKHWPQYWPFCEAILSATATLRLQNVPAAIALFGMGDSGVGKNTVFKMFAWDLTRLILWRDKFTLAALLSHNADDTDKKLNERALFRRAKHKLMVTPELGVLFRGRTYILEERFGELAQWLDGEGRVTDSGTHDALGEKGDFTFVWVAGSTPFYLDTWRTMAALGTRLLFFEVRKGPYVPDDAFASALAECREAVNTFLDVFIPDGTSYARKCSGVRMSEWPAMDATITQTIQNYAALLALGHGMKCNIGGDADTHFPSPNHFRSRLGILIRGEALVHGRTVVLSEDLPMARWITQSSMPGRRGPVLLALLDGGRGVDEIATATGLSKDTVRANLKALVGTGVVDEEPCPVGAVGRPPSSYRINADAFARML